MTVLAQGPEAASELVEAARRALEAALGALGVDPTAEVAVVIADDAVLHRLNLAHRGIDRPTDVLSFPPSDAPDPEGGPRYLGDILISHEVAAASAAAAGHPVADEVRLLAVHGLLHLLGHEDETDEGAARMERLEEWLGVRRPEA